MSNEKSDTLADIADAMRDHDNVYWGGSESAQWQDFCLESSLTYGINPFDENAHDMPVPIDFAAYWLAIADRDYDRAERFGDVPPEWRDDATA